MSNCDETRSPGPHRRGISQAHHRPAKTCPRPHRGPADRGQVHQKPVPALPDPSPIHHLPREHPHRGLSPTRTSLPATPCPCRATDSRVEDPLRGPLRSGGHSQRVRPRPWDAPLPLPRTEQSPHPARPGRHRHQHQAPQRSLTDRGSIPAPPADGLPELPRSRFPGRDPGAPWAPRPQQLQDPRQSQVRGWPLCAPYAPRPTPRAVRVPC